MQIIKKKKQIKNVNRTTFFKSTTYFLLLELLTHLFSTFYIAKCSFENLCDFFAYREFTSFFFKKFLYFTFSYNKCSFIGN